MTANEIRQAFFDFFVSKGHVIITICAYSN